MSRLHISTDGGQPILYDEFRVKSMLEEGQLSGDALYWREGMKDWEPLGKLFPAQSVAPPSSPVSSTSSPYAPPTVDPVAPAPTSFHNQTGFTFTRNPLGLTRFLKIMLGMYIGSHALSVLGEISLLVLLGSETITVEAAEANDALQRLIGFLCLAVFLATTVVFGRWIYVANVNCRGFGAKEMVFTPGWSVGYYFVPILNLFRPFQAMKEIWQVSSDPRRWQNEPGSGTLTAWWTLWIISNIVGQIVFRISMAADTNEMLRVATFVSMFSSLIEITLTLVAMTLVSKIIFMQVRLTQKEAV